MIELDIREQKLVQMALSLHTDSVEADPGTVEQSVTDALAAGATAGEVTAIANVVDAAMPVRTQALAAITPLVERNELGPWTSRTERQLRGYTTQVARREGSSKTTIVLCHSLGTNHRMWEPMVAALPPEFDVVAYDVRNHGPRREAADDVTIPSCAEDLKALLDDLQLSRVYLAGISMGGAIAQEFAAQFPERLAGLSLMACRGKGGASGQERAAAGEHDGLEAQVGVTLSRWLSASFLAENGAWVRYLRQRVLGWNVDAWAKGWRALGNSNTIGRLADLPVSTLCIAGAEDPSSPPQVLQSLVDVLPNASLTVVPGPHLFPLEQPGLVASLVAEHHRSVA